MHFFSELMLRTCFQLSMTLSPFPQAIEGSALNAEPRTISMQGNLGRSPALTSDYLYD